MLKRKMLDKLIAWKQKAGGREALLIEGARRVGKSTIVEEFGRTQYKSYILIDFTRLPRDVRDIFENQRDDFDTFFMLLSAYYRKRLYERESLIIFDEVQRYPAARELIKYLVADGRYDYVETGSLISIKRNVANIVIPSEERKMDMGRSILRSSAGPWGRSCLLKRFANRSSVWSRCPMRCTNER